MTLNFPGIRLGEREEIKAKTIITRIVATKPFFNFLLLFFRR